MEERDERLVGDLLEEELEWVTVVSDAREGVKDRAEHGTACNVADATDLRVGEDGILVVVDERTRLLDHGRRKAEGVGAVVGELRVDVLMHLYPQLDIYEKENQVAPTFHMLSNSTLGP